MEPDPKIKEKMIMFANSEHVEGAIELMKSGRTQLTTILADDEFKTLVNALTLEIESSLIQRFIIEVDNIRTGKNLENE